MTNIPPRSEDIPPASDDATTEASGEGQSFSDVGEKAKEVMGRKAGDIAGEVRATLEDARDVATDKAEATVDRTADDLSRAARALADAARNVEGGGTPQNLLREASHGLMSLSEAMRGKSLGEMVGEVAEFGRRNPGAFLSGAALAGFALAQFGVASHPSPSESAGRPTDVAAVQRDVIGEYDNG